ncbi:MULTISPECIES: hypothetical protein [Microbacterium]|jgi:hypothetical protein|uniref:hypothetical protein n=1 Tax=Microbacterium TaxID=33882 RepID=UPI001D17180D|nr:hypothetical protein [Microbacterium testaceum]MCC4250096.1 hypothetical protein [Microbacterium testaceum]
MVLDVLSLQTAAALVILVSAVMYLLDTLMLRDALPGRLWAAAFLAGVFSAVAYLVWITVPDAFVAVALGNGAFVAATALIWLGCMAFNGRDVRVPVMVASLVPVAVAVLALVEGPAAGDWAGAVALFLGNALFAVLGGIETRRGAVGRRWSAAGLTVVLSVEAVWFLVRTVVFIVQGPESEIFLGFFGTQVSALLTMTLVVAAVVVTSVLRTSESALRGNPKTRQLIVDRNGVLLRESFGATVTIVADRARAAGEDVCVVGIRVDDLRRVATAFGPEEAEEMALAFRASVRRHAPTMALVGEADATGLAIAFATTPGADLRRLVHVLHERVVADLSAVGTSVVPVVGIGVALASAEGGDGPTLVDRADAAAGRAAQTGEQPFGSIGG